MDWLEKYYHLVIEVFDKRAGVSRVFTPSDVETQEVQDVHRSYGANNQGRLHWVLSPMY